MSDVIKDESLDLKVVETFRERAICAAIQGLTSNTAFTEGVVSAADLLQEPDLYAARVAEISVEIANKCEELEPTLTVPLVMGSIPPPATPMAPLDTIL